MNILIIGHMRHGKTTLADIIKEEYGLDYLDSSEAAAEIFIYDELKDKYGYKSYEECFADRKQHRPEWFKMICDYNNPKYRLGKEIYRRAPIYAGMRSNDELQACIKSNLIDLIVGVHRRELPEEPKSSFDIDFWTACDIIIPNNGTIEELKQKVKYLNKLFI